MLASGLLLNQTWTAKVVNRVVKLAQVPLLAPRRLRAKHSASEWNIFAFVAWDSAGLGNMMAVSGKLDETQSVSHPRFLFGSVISTNRLTPTGAAGGQPCSGRQVGVVPLRERAALREFNSVARCFDWVPQLGALSHHLSPLFWLGGFPY